jgi:hypothetical protein
MGSDIFYETPVTTYKSTRRNIPEDWDFQEFIKQCTCIYCMLYLYLLYVVLVFTVCCTCICCMFYLYLLYVFCFVIVCSLFCIVIFMYIYMSICIVCTSVRTTATG